MFAWKRVYVVRTSLCLAIGDVSDGDLCTQMWNDTVSTSIFIYTKHLYRFDPHLFVRCFSAADNLNVYHGYMSFCRTNKTIFRTWKWPKCLSSLQFISSTAIDIRNAQCASPILILHIDFCLEMIKTSEITHHRIRNRYSTRHTQRERKGICDKVTISNCKYIEMFAKTCKQQYRESSVWI